MGSRLDNVRNAFFVILIPYFGYILTTDLLHNSPILVFLGILLLTYPLKWFYNTSLLFKEINEKIIPQKIPILFGSFVFFGLLSFAAGSFVDTMMTNSTANQMLLSIAFYIPLIFVSLIHLIFLIIFIYRNAISIQKMFNINRFISIILFLVIPILPLYQGFIQLKINKYLLENKEIKNDERQDKALEYLKQYSSYSKESLISSLKTNFKLTEEEANEKYKESKE